MKKIGKIITLTAFTCSIVFGQETAMDLIEKSATQHPSVLAKNATLFASEYEKDSAFYQFFATPSVSYERKYNDTDDESTVFKLSQPLFVGGKIKYGYDRAEIAMSIANLNIQDLQDTLAIQMIEALYNYRSALKRVEVQKDTLAKLHGYQEMIQKRANSGISPESDIYLIESRLSYEKNQLTTFETAKDKAKRMIDYLLAEEIEENTLNNIVNSNFENKMITILADGEKGFIETSLFRNPELKKYHNEILKSNKELEIEKSILYPSVYANWINRDGDNIENDTYVGVSVEFKLGAGLSTYSNIQAAKQKTLAFKSEYESKKENLTRTYKDELEEYTQIKTKIVELEKMIKNTTMVVDSYNRLFILGKKSWLDLLNSERELTQYKLNYYDTKSYLELVPLKFAIRVGELSLKNEENN
jgi:adhesin transport system outer membrane protein